MERAGGPRLQFAMMSLCSIAICMMRCARLSELRRTTGLKDNDDMTKQQLAVNMHAVSLMPSRALTFTRYGR